MALPPALIQYEPYLRQQLPAKLYADLWIDPTDQNLTVVMQHLHDLQYLLKRYLPDSLVDDLPEPGQLTWQWQTSALMFTDLAGFTILTQAHENYGANGARFLASLLNSYFSQTIEILNSSGGDLVEFTGDAILVEFPGFTPQLAIAKAIRAGLRLQRMMEKFTHIQTLAGDRQIAMRIGIHYGRFLVANVGTPMRMVRVLLGQTVRKAKQAEGMGQIGRVCVTQSSIQFVETEFNFEPNHVGYFLVQDNFELDTLGNFDITLRKRRSHRDFLFLYRTTEEILGAIDRVLQSNKLLTSFMASPVLKLLVENTYQKKIPPILSQVTVLFINLIGLPEAIDQTTSVEEEARLVKALARIFAQINGLAETEGGFLQNWTYHLYSDILIYFGIPNARADDALRAASTACRILALITEFSPIEIGNTLVKMSCQIGLSTGTVIAGEMGHPTSRRDYNALGNPVNRAAYVMSQAAPNQILMTDYVEAEIRREQDLLNLSLPFSYLSAGKLKLKGNRNFTPIFSLQSAPQNEV